MSLVLNPIIIEKIRNSNYNEHIKKFLEDMLYYELRHFEEGRPRYGKEYDEAIKKYAKKYHGENNEN